MGRGTGILGALTLVALLLALLLAGQTSAQPITKLEGTAGCVADTASPLSGSACTQARALKDVTDVAISPDGKFAYSASFTSSAVNAFSRNPQTGALRQLPGAAGCIVDAAQLRALSRGQPPRERFARSATGIRTGAVSSGPEIFER